jgi:hypothetical protein
VLKDGFNRFFRCLLSGEGSPLVKPLFQGETGMFQVPFGLKDEVPASLHKGSIAHPD